MLSPSEKILEVVIHQLHQQRFASHLSEIRDCSGTRGIGDLSGNYKAPTLQNWARKRQAIYTEYKQTAER